MSNLRVDELESLTTGRTIPVDKIDTGVREDLANPDKGAAMVGYGDGTVADKLNEIVSGAVTEPLVDAKVDTHNHDPAAHPEFSAYISQEADRAEAAADIASTAGLIFPTSAEGQASSVLIDGDYFWVESGSDGGLLELWRKGASTPTNTGRTTVSENLVATVQGAMTPRGELWEESSNLLNASTNTIGKQITVGGEAVDNPAIGHTDYIPVVPGGSYVSTSFTAVTFYDASLGYISRNGTIGASGASPWITPARARFVRLNYALGAPSVRTARVNAGTTLRDFEEYYRKLLPHVGADFSQVTGQITASQASFLQTNDNMFDHTTTTAGVIILSSGEIGANADYSISDFIPIEPSSQYTLSGAPGSGFYNVAYYDANKAFMSRVNIISNPATVTAPAGALFVRLNFKGSADRGERMMNAGATALPFEFRAVELSGVSLGKEIDDMVDKVLSSGDRFMSDVPLEGIFSGVDYSGVWPEYARNTTAAAVYQKYDELMTEFPEYISKQVLGEDDFGNTISAYHLSPGWPDSSFDDLKRPKIFITAGTHGSEPVASLACYLTFRDMLVRWQEDPLLEALKYNADYIIIPVVNPSGWDIYSRKNGNGVDINRNFPDGWALRDPDSVTYGGPEPFSEPESLLIKKVFDENPDIAVCYDFHNFGGPPNTSGFIWIPTGQGRRVQHMACNLITSLTRKWRKEDDEYPPEPYFAGSTDSTRGAMIHDYAQGLGIKYGATFEVAGWVDPSVPFDGTHRTWMVEAWANWLLINLRELKRDL